jgi:hypothetical protein
MGKTVTIMPVQSAFAQPTWLGRSTGVRITISGAELRSAGKFCSQVTTTFQKFSDFDDKAEKS